MGFIENRMIKANVSVEELASVLKEDVSTIEALKDGKVGIQVLPAGKMGVLFEYLNKVEVNNNRLDLKGIKLTGFDNAREMIKSSIEFIFKLEEFMHKLNDNFRMFLTTSLYKDINTRMIYELNEACQELSEDYLKSERNLLLTKERLETIIDTALLRLEISEEYCWDPDVFFAQTFEIKLKALIECMTPMEVKYIDTCCEYEVLEKYIYYLVS